MKSKAPLVTLLGIVLPIALAIAWNSRRAAQEAADSLADLARKRAAVEGSVQHLQKSIAFDERDNGDIRASISAQREAASPRGRIRVTPRLTGAQRLALVAADPKLFALGMKAYQSSLNTIYGQMFRTLNLPPEEVTKFKSLAAAHMEAIVDILSSASTQGMQLNDPAVGTLMKDENTQFDAAQKSLLGDAAYQQMQQLNRQMPVSGVAYNVATQVALTSTPLSTAQADQLTQILANSSTQYQNGGYATPNTINWPTALGQAQALLTPTQFQALQGRYNSIQVNQLMTQFNAQQKGK
jgi:hypothetical protein